MGSYALLLDGGFVHKVLRQRRGVSPTAAEILAECRRIRAETCLAGLELLRIYWYDAPPATKSLRHPIDGKTTHLGKTSQHQQAKALHDALELTPDFALRMGALDVRGWRIGSRRLEEVVRRPDRGIRPEDLQPDISQKGVDLRIGLDIARLSLRQLVDVLVVVTGDSDLVPAFKFARREGLRVYLDHLGAKSIMRSLKVHVDRVL